MATKVSLKDVLNEFAKAAGYKDIATVQALTSTNSTYGGTHWSYGSAGKTYGGPVDCSGLFYAIAKQLGSDYSYLSSGKMKDDMGTSSIDHKDYGKIPVGAFLFRTGHVALYVGNNRIINAADTTWGVCTRANNMDTFTDWGYVSFIEY